MDGSLLRIFLVNIYILLVTCAPLSGPSLGGAGLSGPSLGGLGGSSLGGIPSLGRNTRPHLGLSSDQARPKSTLGSRLFGSQGGAMPHKRRHHQRIVKMSCEPAAQPKLRYKLGTAFNGRYMSIEEPEAPKKGNMPHVSLVHPPPMLQRAKFGTQQDASLGDMPQDYLRDVDYVDFAVDPDFRRDLPNKVISQQTELDDFFDLEKSIKIESDHPHRHKGDDAKNSSSTYTKTDGSILTESIGVDPSELKALLQGGFNQAALERMLSLHSDKQGTDPDAGEIITSQSKPQTSPPIEQHEDMNVHPLPLDSGGSNDQIGTGFRTGFLGRRKRGLDSVNNGKEDVPDWKCQSEDEWVDLGPDYFPRYLRQVKCIGGSCWNGFYTCRERSFTVKILRRLSDRCIPVVPADTSTSLRDAETSYEQAWVFEERALPFCCECEKPQTYF